MFDHYIHAFLLIHFTYTLLHNAIQRVRDVFFGPPGTYLLTYLLTYLQIRRWWCTDGRTRGSYIDACACVKVQRVGTGFRGAARDRRARHTSGHSSGGGGQTRESRRRAVQTQGISHDDTGRTTRYHANTFAIILSTHVWVNWRRGVVVSGVRRINEVNARRARLVVGWVTVFGRVFHLGM